MSAPVTATAARTTVAATATEPAPGDGAGFAALLAAQALRLDDGAQRIDLAVRPNARPEPRDPTPHAAATPTEEPGPQRSGAEPADGVADEREGVDEATVDTGSATDPATAAQAAVQAAVLALQRAVEVVVQAAAGEVTAEPVTGAEVTVAPAPPVSLPTSPSTPTPAALTGAGAAEPGAGLASGVLDAALRALGADQPAAAAASVPSGTGPVLAGLPAEASITVTGPRDPLQNASVTAVLAPGDRLLVDLAVTDASAPDATTAPAPATGPAAVEPPLAPAATGDDASNSGATDERGDDPAPPAPAVPLPSAATTSAGTVQPAQQPVAVPGTETPRPVTEQVAQQLSRQLSGTRHLADGTHSTVIRLSPEALGDVTVRLDVRDGGVTMQLIATPQALGALQDDLARLRDQLAQSGLDLGEVTFSASDPGADPGRDRPTPGQTAGQSAEQGSGRTSDGGGRPGAVGPGEPAAPRRSSGLHAVPTPVAPTGTVGVEGRVDVRV